MSTHTEHAENPKAEALKYVATLVVLLILTGICVERPTLILAPATS